MAGPLPPNGFNVQTGPGGLVFGVFPLGMAAGPGRVAAGPADDVEAIGPALLEPQGMRCDRSCSGVACGTPEPSPPGSITIVCTAMDRLSVTMDPELGRAVRDAADRAGVSVSQWLSEAAADKVRNALLGTADVVDAHLVNLAHAGDTC